MSTVMDNTRPSSTDNAQLRGACYLCSAHGIVALQRVHVCPFAFCRCSQCNVIRVRRAIVAAQLRMRREEKKALGDAYRSYTCNRCRNHDIHVLKKGHKGQCAYEHCECPKCTLCHSRTILDASFRANGGGAARRRRVAKSVSPSPSSTLDVAPHANSAPVSPSTSPAISPISMTTPLLMPQPSLLSLDYALMLNGFRAPAAVPLVTPQPVVLNNPTQFLNPIFGSYEHQCAMIRLLQLPQSMLEQIAINRLFYPRSI